MRGKETDEKQRQHSFLKATNYIFALFFFCIGAMIDWIVLADHYTVWGEYSPGTGFFPLMTGLLMMLASVVAAVQTAKGAYVTKKGYPGRKKIKNMAAFMGIVVAGLLLTGLLGLIVSLFLIFTLIMLIVYRYPWWYSLLVSAITTGVIYLVFVVGFAIRFPVGILGF
ncbi:MAG: tripartite tricarboxylate transporter TctB family protein [Lachnospiraceae bacterium]|nr:tripartite tricarboxylate transporter TctB family protein [Lachnospiraceae bacterium]